MNCYLWELEAILEGLALRELDRREQEAIFGFNLRYILNAKKPQLSKVIKKDSAEKKIIRAFDRTQKQVKRDNKRLDKALKALEHFKNRG